MNFLELTQKRFSARKFTAEPVSQEDLDYIMECVRLAPSACNKQPWNSLLCAAMSTRKSCGVLTTASGSAPPRSTLCA